MFVASKYNRTHTPQIPEKKKSADSVPKEIWCQIFSSLSAGDLVNCSRVCSNWNKALQEDTLWKSVLLNKLGPAAIDLITPVVVDGTLSWKEAYQFSSLISFISDMITREYGDAWKCESEIHSYKYFGRSSLVSYRNWRFSITNLKDVKVQNGKDPPFILEGEKDQDLVRLAAEGDFLFSLSYQGTLTKWNLKTKEKQNIPHKSDIQLAYGTAILKVEDGLIFLLGYENEIIPYNSPNDSFICEITPRFLYRMLKNQNKLYFIARNFIVIFDLVTKQTHRLNCAISMSNFIDCMAIEKDTIWVAVNGKNNGKEILVYDSKGSRIKKLSLDLNTYLGAMIVKNGLIFGLYCEKKMISANQAIYYPCIAVIDSHTGNPVDCFGFKDLFNREKKAIPPEFLKRIFNLVKTRSPQTISYSNNNNCRVM